MITGYVRQDVTNQIADGVVASAVFLDQEFDALQASFASNTGHTHSGVTGEGAPITVVGPAQDVVVTGLTMEPKSNDVLSLGTTLLRFKDLWLTGVATVGSLVAGTANILGGTINGTTIGATTPAAITGTTITGSNFIGPIEGNASSATTLATPRLINGTSFNGSADIVTTNWGTVRTITIGGAAKFVDGSANVTWTLGELGLGTLSSQNSNAVAITGGTISGITDLAIDDGGTGASTPAQALINFGLTATAAEINKLDGVTATTAEINILSGLTKTTSDLNNYLVPAGGIIIWSGAQVNIPSGWVLCDGLNGTPDLRDRFVVGAGGAYAVGDTGGAESVSLTAPQNGPHTHGVVGNTSSDGNHTHGGGLFRSGSSFIIDTLGGALHGTGDTDPSGAHSHSINFTSGSSGTGAAHENRPPYYALAYIMKL